MQEQLQHTELTKDTITESRMYIAVSVGPARQEVVLRNAVSQRASCDQGDIIFLVCES
jgi:hypothetical protein